MIVLMVLSLFSGVYQYQKKYDYCKSIEFKGQYCQVQKKLNEYER